MTTCDGWQQVAGAKQRKRLGRYNQHSRLAEEWISHLPDEGRKRKSKKKMEGISMSRFRTEKVQFIQDRCRGKKVLDVGCVEHTLEETEHPEWLHAKIAKVAGSLLGLDYEKEAVDVLNQRGWHMLAVDAQNFDIRDQYPDGFDVIVASEIIEHLVNPGGFFLSLKKHLAPGGIIILTTPHAYGLVYFTEVVLLGEEKINDDHTMTFSKKNLDHLLDKCGLMPVEFHYLNQMGLWRPEWWAKAVCRLWWLFQYLIVSIRPSLSRELLYVVGPKPTPQLTPQEEK